MFSSALQSGQLAPLMGQFGFSDEVMGAASRGGKPVGHFLVGWSTLCSTL